MQVSATQTGAAFYPRTVTDSANTTTGWELDGPSLDGAWIEVRFPDRAYHKVTAIRIGNRFLDDSAGKSLS